MGRRPNAEGWGEWWALRPGGKEKGPRSVHGVVAAPVDKAGDFEARRLLGFRRRNPGRSPRSGRRLRYNHLTCPVFYAHWITSFLV